MGAILSKARILYKSLFQLSTAYDNLHARLGETPGLPLPNPSPSYWAIPTNPHVGLDVDSLPIAEADVVIIGSGITGCSVARTLLRNDESLRIVMVEARDACSDGGHITPPLHHDYEDMKEAYGEETARQIIRFRLAHLQEFLKVASEEGLLEDSQCRVVDTYDVYFELAKFEELKRSLKVYLEDFPDQKELWRVYEDKADFEALQLSPKTKGVVSTKGGAMHPYRFVTGILANLLSRYNTNFHLFTHAPCTGIFYASSSRNSYVIQTPKGSIKAKHVVHATNAWISHLLPEMRKKIVPVRGHMTAQRPGLSLGQSGPRAERDSKQGTTTSWIGTRSFVFYGATSTMGYDYLTCQPYNAVETTLPSYSSSESADKQAVYPTPRGEFMFGGGAVPSRGQSILSWDALGNVNDTETTFSSGAYLGGILPAYFGSQNWGKEAQDSDDGADSKWNEGRVKSLWTGILSISADGRPWVGRLPEKLTKRDLVASPDSPTGESIQTITSSTTTSAGEWISAGYTGEGMVHAWKSGEALGRMILGLEDAQSSLPEPFRVGVERWKAANIENLFEGL